MSDEGKRWKASRCRGCGGLVADYGPSGRQQEVGIGVPCVFCGGEPDLIEVVPASELDRLEAELTKAQRYEHRTAKRAEAAEARVRKLEGALMHISRHSPEECGAMWDQGDCIHSAVDQAQAALDAPAEDGQT